MTILQRAAPLGFVVGVLCASCHSVPLVAPSESSVTLVVSDPIVPTGGSATVTARVVEAAGTPVHDGTVVTFGATLGEVHPPEAPTQRGQATATFTAGGESGLAAIRAYSGAAISEPATVTIGAAAVANLRVSAQPGALPPEGGRAAIAAVVLDANQQPLPGVAVSFSTTAGTLGGATATTDGGGYARTTLSTRTTAAVTAAAGDDVEATTTVTVAPATGITITATPATPVVGQAVTFMVTLRNEAHAIRNAAISFGDGRSRNLGATMGVAVAHSYEASGIYTVTVEATDAAGHRVSASTVVQVDQAPGISVAVTASPPAPVVGQPVTFTVTVTPPANGPALRGVVIDFADGSRESLGQLTGTTTVAHGYEKPGSRVVSVTARDAAGRSYTASVGVTVSAAPPVSVAVTASPSAPVVGQPVTFTVTVTPPANGPGVEEVEIAFDDGSDESLGALIGARTVAHIYERAGSYVVKVTAEDTAGRESAASVGLAVSGE